MKILQNLYELHHLLWRIRLAFETEIKNLHKNVNILADRLFITALLWSIAEFMLVKSVVSIQ